MRPVCSGLNIIIANMKECQSRKVSWIMAINQNSVVPPGASWRMRTCDPTSDKIAVILKTNIYSRDSSAFQHAGDDQRTCWGQLKILRTFFLIHEVQTLCRKQALMPHKGQKDEIVNKPTGTTDVISKPCFRTETTIFVSAGFGSADIYSDSVIF